VNDTIQVTVKGLLAGRECDTVFYIQASRPITGDSETKARALLNAWQTNLVQSFSVAYTCTGAHFIDLDSLTGDHGDIAADPTKPTAGTDTPGISPQVALLIRKNVQGAPRSVSFRHFWPAPGEGSVDQAGVLGTSYRTTVQGQINTFQSTVDVAAGVGVSESHLVAVSFPRDGLGHVSGPGTAYDISTMTLQSKVATMRRRLRG